MPNTISIKLVKNHIYQFCHFSTNLHLINKGKFGGSANFSNSKIDEDLRPLRLLCIVISHQQCTIPTPGNQDFLYICLKTQLCISVWAKSTIWFPWCFKRAIGPSDKECCFLIRSIILLSLTTWSWVQILRSHIW